MNPLHPDLIDQPPRSNWNVPALTRWLTGAFLFIAAACAGALALPLVALIAAASLVARKAIAYASGPHDRSRLEP